MNFRATSDLHPVVSTIVGQVVDGDVRARPLYLHTRTHWLTGKELPLELDLSGQHLDGLLIIDAAQTVGTVTSKELATLLGGVDYGCIVVGCLQKWIGSPIPAGFALFSTDLFSQFPELERFLASRDYLGSSIQPRIGYSGFPDTYSSILAGPLMPFIELALGLRAVELDQRVTTIAVNRHRLLSAFDGLSSVEPVCHAESRSMVALQGQTARVKQLSVALAKSGFIHSLLQPSTNSPPILRLSSPVCTMASREWGDFLDLLRGLG